MPSSSFNVKRFNELMDLSGLSFREVAAGTGLTTQTVASYGNGKVDPSLSAYIAIVNFLNVPLEYLVEDPSKKSVPRGKKGRSNSRESSSNLLELSLNGRTYNAICRAGIKSIEELNDAISSGEFARRRGVGKKMVEEASIALEAFAARKGDSQLPS